MSLKDKLEVGLKPDAPYRKDNLPEGEQPDPSCDEAAAPRAGEPADRAREDCDNPAPKITRHIDKVTGRR